MRDARVFVVLGLFAVANQLLYLLGLASTTAAITAIYQARLPKL